MPFIYNVFKVHSNGSICLNYTLIEMVFFRKMVINSEKNPAHVKTDKRLINVFNLVG